VLSAANIGIDFSAESTPQNSLSAIKVGFETGGQILDEPISGTRYLRSLQLPSVTFTSPLVILRISATDAFGSGVSRTFRLECTVSVVNPVLSPSINPTAVPVNFPPALVSQIEPSLTCPANTTQIALVNSPQSLTIGDSAISVPMQLPVNSTNGFLLVASAVGHPEAGCPNSNDPLCSQNQDNEEFGVAANNSQVALVQDHGENQWKTFTFPLSLNAGDYTVEFSHTNRVGNNIFGSVSFKATYCAANQSISNNVQTNQVISLPEPPPAKLCVDMNFEANGVVRAQAEDERDRTAINCRLIVENERFLAFNGGALTGPEQIGNASVTARGVIQAVDVFSPSGSGQFNAGVAVCLRGIGALVSLDASTSPRSVIEMTEWRTDAFVGFTCGTLYGPATLVLVRG
jgi:hypothetical protein